MSPTPPRVSFASPCFFLRESPSFNGPGFTSPFLLAEKNLGFCKSLARFLRSASPFECNPINTFVLLLFFFLFPAVFFLTRAAPHFQCDLTCVGGLFTVSPFLTAPVPPPFSLIKTWPFRLFHHGVCLGPRSRVLVSSFFPNPEIFSLWCRIFPTHFSS